MARGGGAPLPEPPFSVSSAVPPEVDLREALRSREWPATPTIVAETLFCWCVTVRGRAFVDQPSRICELSDPPRAALLCARCGAKLGPAATAFWLQNPPNVTKQYMRSQFCAACRCIVLPRLLRFDALPAAWALPQSSGPAKQ